MNISYTTSAEPKGLGTFTHLYSAFSYLKKAYVQTRATAGDMVVNYTTMAAYVRSYVDGAIGGLLESAYVDRQVPFLRSRYPNPVAVYANSTEIHLFSAGSATDVLIEIEFKCNDSAPPIIMFFDQAGGGVAYPFDSLIEVITTPGLYQKAYVHCVLTTRTPSGTDYIDAWTKEPVATPPASPATRVEVYAKGAAGAAGLTTINLFIDDLGWFDSYRVRFYEQ